MSGSVRIAVAAHKPYWMPQDSMYVPVQAGAALAAETIPGFRCDDEGRLIPEGWPTSAENPRYCELTALAWAARNLDADYVGLAHYRRHFAGSGERGVMTAAEATDALSNTPALLPKERNYYVSTVESHYGSTFDLAQVESLRRALSELEPVYLPAFERRMAGTRLHICNMLVMRSDLLRGYLSWLFPLLRRAEAEIDFSDMTPFESRCMGRLSELLLDVWLDTEGVEYAERPAVSLERTNWVKKGGAFLAAKFLGRKYKRSF